MASARPLRDVFSELAASGPGAGADAVLAAHGHGELPEGLVAEAVVSYADTAPVEVAEHLAPFVMAHSPVYPAVTDPGSWLDVLTTAPEALDAEPEVALPEAVLDVDPADLDFGGGAPAAGTESLPDADDVLQDAPFDVPDDVQLPVVPAGEALSHVDEDTDEPVDFDDDLDSDVDDA
jgi:hypothetical protein